MSGFNLFGHVMGLVFGEVPNHKRGQFVTVCNVNGCMAERLDPVYKGIIMEKTRIHCHGTRNKDGKIPAVVIQATEVFSGDKKVGMRYTELSERLRKLTDGSYVVAK